ncbi:MAG TPA: hypothetical protein PLI45_01230 [Candidatus Woesebacteria bacterium]|nr:hypothetical protein [Candidatus Woesebacteria bacterium]
MKSVQIYPNSKNNNACLQSCVKSVLDYFKLSREFSNVEKSTGYHEDSFSWIPKTVVWLNSLGFDVCFYSEGDYERVAKEGIEYLKEIKGTFFNLENERGDYKYMNEVQDATKEMLSKDLWKKEKFDDSQLSEALKNDNCLAIGKTVHQWLDGYIETINPSQHWIILIQEFSPDIWRINDPGLPPIQNRTVYKQINGIRIVGEILLIKHI